MDRTTKEYIAEMICGDDREKHPVYRSSSYLTRFFQDIGINQVHDGSTRKWWTLAILDTLSPDDLQKVILRLASPKLYGGDRAQIHMALSTLNQILSMEGLKIRLDGVQPTIIRETPNFNFNEEEIERELKPLPPPDFDSLALEPGLAEILHRRWSEIQRCIDNGATLSAVIMMGSMLEGFLLGTMQRFPKIANTARNSPTKDGHVKHFADWSLSEMIDVSHEVGWIHLDVKKFSHALRDFRNLIHPYQQLALATYPDQDTCKISWLVVQAACSDIAEWVKRNRTQQRSY